MSKQYEAEMEQEAGQVGELQEQLQRLEEAVKDLKPQLALAEDLKQQVKRLAADYRRSPKCCAGCERDLEEAAAGTAARAGARLWPEPVGAPPSGCSIELVGSAMPLCGDHRATTRRRNSKGLIQP